MPTEQIRSINEQLAEQVEGAPQRVQLDRAHDRTAVQLDRAHDRTADLQAERDGLVVALTVAAHEIQTLRADNRRESREHWDARARANDLLYTAADLQANLARSQEEVRNRSFDAKVARAALDDVQLTLDNMAGLADRFTKRDLVDGLRGLRKTVRTQRNRILAGPPAGRIPTDTNTDDEED